MKIKTDILGLKQPNFISHSIQEIGITTTAYKLIRIGCYQLLENLKDKEDLKNPDYYTVSFSVKDFCKFLGCKKGGKQLTLIEKALDEITSSKIKIESKYVKNSKLEKNYIYIVWAIMAEKKQSQIEIQFNPVMINLMLENMKQYSWLELQTIGKLKSIYSLRIYELLKSFYNTKGKYGNAKNEWKTEYYTVGYLREFFSVQNKYKRENDFINKCIKSQIEEINKTISEINSTENVKLNFTVDYDILTELKEKKICFVGREIISSNSLKFSKKDSFQEKEEKIEILNQDIELENIKSQYTPEEWKELQEEAIKKSQNPLFLQKQSKISDFNKDIETLSYIKNLKK